MERRVLETERLFLRPEKEEEDRAGWRWEDKGAPAHGFVFVEKESGERVGCGGLFFSRIREMWEFGCYVEPVWRNRRFGTEAAGRILEHGQRELGIRRFGSRQEKGDSAAAKFLEKSGFLYVREGGGPAEAGTWREYILEASEREKSAIERFYDEHEEWERLAWHLPEFEVTKRYLQKYITGKKAVLDVGGGPGRYAIYLAQQGHEVTLLDLSGKNIRTAIEKAKEAGVHLDSCIHGDALLLSEYLYRPEQFDVVLLMGPLYHLLQKEDREKAVRESIRALRPGGLLIAAFISAYAPIQDYAGELKDFGDMERLFGYLEDGRNREDGADGFTVAYFTSAEEAREMMEAEGLEELVFAGVENVLCGKEKALHSLPEQLREKWLELAWRLSGDKNLLGMSEHFLYIGRKGA